MIHFNERLVLLSIFLVYFQTEGIQRTTYGPEISSLNIDKVWAQNITGKNVVVAVLDDGVNYNHIDLKHNYERTISYDFASNHSFPLPSRGMTHGTQCAGIIAARQHGYCRTGIAYNSKLAAIRLFNGISVNTKSIIRGFGYKKNVIDIYSNSWGPADNGFSMRRPGRRQMSALEDGARHGRKGLGSIFVFSSGNGGRFGDSCAFDGYVNNIHTIAIGAFSLKDGVPRFTERCSSVLAAAYGDNVKTCSGPYSRCVNDFGRTSASAAMASGIIALVLEANNQLTWRDIQHLIVRTSNPRGANIDAREWAVNGAGLMVHPAVGFGVMNAKELVDVARNNWKTVPQQRNCSIEISYLPRRFQSTGYILQFSSKRTKECAKINVLEHVQVEFSLEFLPRAIMEMYVTSPQGTKSQLLYKRPFDALSSKKRYIALVMTSLHFWGENLIGGWTVLFKSAESMRSIGSSYGTLRKFKITFYGTGKDPLSDNLLPKGTITCGDKKFWKRYGSVCCGFMSTYHPQRESCCPGTYKIVNKNPRCGSIRYNGCEKMCCNGVLQNKVKDNVVMSCCGTQSYNKNKQICCGDKPYTRYICKHNWWRNGWFIHQNKCLNNRYIRSHFTEKSCPRRSPKPVKSKEVCKDKERNCHTFYDCTSWMSLKHKRENCAKTCRQC